MILEKEQETKSFLVYREKTTDTRIDVDKARLEKAVRELYHWQQNPQATFFTAQLYNLACKADAENAKKLLLGFPARMIAYLLWYTAHDQDEFFHTYMNLTEKEQNNEDIDY